MPKSARRPSSAALRVVCVPVDSLHTDPSNARRHGEASIDAIAASLQRFGQQKPIVIDAAGVVIAGNGTLEAARRLGWKTVSAVRSGLGGVERVAYSIADNHTAELSEWDRPTLLKLLGAMDSLDGVGFSAADVQAMLEAEAGQAQEVPAPAPAGPAVARRGELWKLGEHRLLCGDSTNQEDVRRVMGDDRAALVATDPPYLVDYTGVRAGGRGKDWSDTYREIDVKDAQGFFASVFANAAAVAAPGAAFYCWHAHKRATEIVAAWRACGILDHQQIVWVKPVPVFGSVFWHFRHEPCLMGWVQGSKPRHDGRHEHDSVWTSAGTETPIDEATREQLVELLKAASSAWEIGWNGKGRPVGNEHPTEKPVEIFARPMRKHTRKGDVVFEPFSGSGSQIVAAEQIGRRCLAIELEPVYVDVAIRRWQSMTGRSAVRDGDGVSWGQKPKAASTRRRRA